MPKFNPPDSFQFDKPADLPEWKQRFLRFRSATKLDRETSTVQVSSLVYAAEKIYSSFQLATTVTAAASDADAAAVAAAAATVPDANNFDLVMKRFDAYFIPKRNVIHDRAKFHLRVQQAGENAESFYRSLMELSERCDFKDKNEEIRDRLVIGILDKELSLELQLKADLTLENCVDRVRNSEMVKKQNEVLKGVDHVSRGGRRGRFHQGFKPEGTRRCTNCNLLLDYRHTECPAKDEVCNNCGKKGHYARCCRSDSSTRGSGRGSNRGSGRGSGRSRGRGNYRGRGGYRKNLDEVSEEYVATDTDDTYFLGSIFCDSPVVSCNDNSRAQFCSINCDITDETKWYIDLEVNGDPINFKIDSRADVTVISEDIYRRIPNRPHLKPSNLGQFVARTLYKGEKFHYLVQVVKGTTTSLLGRGPCVRLGLIAHILAVEAHSVPEPGIGTLKGDPVKIMLKGNAQPYSVSTARRVPIPLMPKVKAELERMECEGVISSVSEPTEWCAPMVPVIKKSGDVRICVDLKHLNESIVRSKFVIPTKEDILSKLSDGTVVWMPQVGFGKFL